MDVLLTCSEMGGEAAWRSVLTMGGVIFDSPDIAGFIAAIGSGLPGMYVLRLFGDMSTFADAERSIRGTGASGGGNAGSSGMEARSARDRGAEGAGGECERGAGGRVVGMELSLPTVDAGAAACA